MIAYPLQAGPTLTRILEAGDPTAPAIVLLHGFTSRADRWRRNIDALAADDYRVVAPDLPGHGFANKDPDFDHSVPAYCDFVRHVLDELGIDRASLVGTSLGGHILARLACREPARAERLVMIGSMGLQNLPEAQVTAMRAGLDDISDEAVRRRLNSVLSDPAIVTDELVREDVRINTSPGANASLHRFGRYLADRFAGDLVLDELTARDGAFPLLLLWGDQDLPAPVEIARRARAMLPRARLAVLKGLNHTPYLEDPSLFNALLLAFIQGTLEAFQSDRVSLE